MPFAPSHRPFHTLTPGRRPLRPLVALGLMLNLAAVAQTPTAPDAPATAPLPPAVPAAQKTPYLGTVQVDVDATDVERRIMRIHETLPVQPGRLTLHYPRFLPGTHGPYGDPNELAGLQVSAGGQPLAWTRDPVAVSSVHVDVPAGVGTIELAFQFLSPVSKDGGRIVMTPQMLNVEWDRVVFYPAGHEAGFITMAPRVKLPAGWQQGSGLRGQAGADGWWTFEPVSLETLIDSPIFAGRHFKQVPLDPPGTPRPIVLNVVADTEAQLKATDAQWQAHRELVKQADRLYGARHFRHYDFLLSLSDTMGGEGLEHHESSENGVQPDYFQEWDKSGFGRDLLPHEFTHSWNGKFRRPADLWTPDYNSVPMRGSGLWMYEGQTQYWGKVLAARSRLTTPEQARDALAGIAAWAEQRAGRAWRNLQDTTNDPALNGYSVHKPWRNWERGVDYYDEMVLVWLDADTLIREKSADRRSLDDFARAFFGVQDGRVQPLTYSFDDIVRTLAAVQPHDWAAFLRERLDTHDKAPLDGLARAGWKLVYTDKQSDDAKARDEQRHAVDFSYSIGLRIGSEDQELEDVAWDGPAFRAGLRPGMKLVAVNGAKYKDGDRLAQAITAAKDGAPIELLMEDGEYYRSVRIDWRGGLRYPALERLPGTPDRLAKILAPR